MARMDVDDENADGGVEADAGGGGCKIAAEQR